MTAIPTKAPKPSLSQRMKRLAKQYWKYRYLMMLLIPSVAMLIIFKYVPMYGVTIAFKNFKLRQGILGSPGSASTCSRRFSPCPCSGRRLKIPPSWA